MADRLVLNEKTEARMMAAALQVLHARYPSRRFEIVPKKPATADAFPVSGEVETLSTNDIA